MGYGYAVTENYAYTDEAKPATKNFQTYLIPTMADMPNVEITPVAVSYTHLDVYKRQEDPAWQQQSSTQAHQEHKEEAPE